MIETHTINIDNIKKVLNSCPNYDYIIYYEFDYNDKFTIDLIDWYKDLIFSCNTNNSKETKVISIIDKCMYLYVQKNSYRRGLKKIITIEEINSNNNIQKLIRKIINYTKKYENMEVLNIKTTKWL